MNREHEILFRNIQHFNETRYPTEQGIVYSIRNLFITDDDDLCVVCYSNLPDITFYPCGHDNCCSVCYERLNGKCPYCRSEIISTDRENPKDPKDVTTTPSNPSDPSDFDEELLIDFDEGYF